MLAAFVLLLLLVLGALLLFMRFVALVGQTGLLSHLLALLDALEDRLALGGVLAELADLLLAIFPLGGSRPATPRRSGSSTCVSLAGAVSRAMIPPPVEKRRSARRRCSPRVLITAEL